MQPLPPALTVGERQRLAAAHPIPEEMGTFCFLLSLSTGSTGRYQRTVDALIPKGPFARMSAVERPHGDAPAGTRQGRTEAGSPWSVGR